ncbi:hypothetical protein [Cellulophaga omnivescoria]|uniref:hypothetical protein n=1 Tax=Cellulophaga omnivescoria TaxID=1888890 RepID=UPI003EBA0BC0
MSQVLPTIDDLTAQVVSKIGNPVSVMVVKATLESFGLREKDMLKDYGYNSLDGLSSFIYNKLKATDEKKLFNVKELEKKETLDKNIPVSGYLWVKAKLLFKFYPIGLFHLFPVLLQIVTIVFFGYSLWTFTEFNVMQSTAVVVGVMLGLIISGGYVQVLGKQASFYWNHKEYYKSKIVINKLIKSGIYGICAVFTGLAAVNFLFSLFPFTFWFVTFMYSLLIGTLLLYTAPFHTIKQRWVISVVVLIATVLALFLKLHTSIHIYITHWLGISTAIGLSKLFLAYFLKPYVVSTEGEIRPKRLIVLYRNYFYFFYGALIYVFIFLDRILAWSADVTQTKKFLFLYEKDYEIGMDLAILVFFLLAGVMEYAIAAFSKFLDVNQKKVQFLQTKQFNSQFYKMYWGHIALLFVSTMVAVVILYYIITEPWGYFSAFGEQLGALSIKVCVFGGVGYFFLTWAMLNTLYLFTLNKPHKALRALLISVVVNFIVGFILSRTISYEYSVVGMLVGSIVFLVLTLRDNYIFFKKLDYYYYAAY